MKRNRVYPEAKHRHDLPSLETPSLKLTHSISHSTSKERVLAAKGHTRGWEQAYEKRGRTSYLQGKIATNSLTEQRTSGNPNVCLVLLYNGKNGVSYVQALPKGYSKKQHMSGGPSLYVRTKNKSVRLPNLAYVRLQRISVWLLNPTTLI